MRFIPNSSYNQYMVSSSSSSHSTPASFSQLWKYDVFLSFRGKDTRKTLVDHLYSALAQQGIQTYKDDETLPRGESITPSLLKAIQESRIAIVVFSENYANSSWCLDELACIVKCMDERGQIVMPIFYDVDPSEVRNQKRKYGEAFTKYESENKDIVESWRKALLVAGNLSGWVPKDIEDGHESRCIKQIVDTISYRLHPLTSSVDDNLVGLESRMRDLISKLQVGFGGKRMIGIWGLGGGGKTTLASYVYDEICSKFDGCCFIKNIREESIKKGLENLQKEILCVLSKQKQVEVGRVEEGRRLIKDRLHHRKVLVVLDDVSSIEHLEELAGSRDWFGEGSRIIITTRDEHVLTSHKVDVIHNISLLNNDEAMNLFCKHAPRGYKHVEHYEQLSKDVVSYTGGLPLALRVLGRFLCDKSMNEWRSALARLNEIPDANILEVLKISVDGLTPIERELFLDIACFFRGRPKDKEVMMILDACGFHPIIGIKVLVQKALITISWDEFFDMHDLVQELAHYIVRREHPKNPEKHSRIWKMKDVLNICAMDTTTNLDKIEVINSSCLSNDESLRVLQAAGNMKKLRWINGSFIRTKDGLLFETTLPLMPEHFPPRELCCLTLFGFHAKQLWEGYKFLPNLKMIKLQNLKNLIKTPDFDGLLNLERFIVERCPLLEEIHPSFGNLEMLLYVAIKDCDIIKMLPPITSSKLESFVLSNCKYLSKIQQNAENCLPHNMNHIGRWIFNGCLRKLNLKQCNLVDGDIGSAAIWDLPNLQELNLEGNRFVRLNFSLLRLPQLKWLKVSYCEGLIELSELPSSIAVVIADGCSSLESFGDISRCKWLWKISFQFGNKLGQLGGDILLDSMFQGNSKDYFFSINLSDNYIPRGFLSWLDLDMTLTMPLPHDWYNDFCGILMCVKCDYRFLVDIIIKQGVDKDFHSERGYESNETLETRSHHTYIGYVSFSSLWHTGCLNSTNNIVSFSHGFRHRFRAIFVPKDDLTQTKEVATDCSEFWNEKFDTIKTFTIQQGSNSSVKLSWKPVPVKVTSRFSLSELKLFPISILPYCQSKSV